MADPGAPSGVIAQLTTTSGLGSYTLGMPIRDKLPISAAYVDGVTIKYQVTDDSGTQEISMGVFTAPNTLTRDTLVLSSTGSFIDWPFNGQRTVIPIVDLPICDAIPTDGQLLAWDGVEWCPITPTVSNDVVVVCPTAPLDGQVLIWSDAENAYCPADFCTLVAACLAPVIPPPPAVFAVGAYSTGVGAGHAINDPFNFGLGLAVHQLVANGLFDHGLNTTGPALIVVAITILQTDQINSGLSGSPNPTVTSVTSPNLTLTLKHRAGTSMDADFFPPADAHIEIWTAIATEPLTNERILATLSGNVVNALMAAVAFYDANLTAPWDTNPSLPALASNVHKTPTALNQVSAVSTTFINDVLLGVTVSGSAGIWGASNTGGAFDSDPYTVMALQSTDSPFSDFLMSMQVWLVAANTLLSNVTAPYGGQTFPTGTNVTSFYNGDIPGDISAGSWFTLVDAIHLYHPSPLNSPPRSPLEGIISWQ